MAQRRETDSVLIKKKLQEKFPKFKFSVTRNDFAGGHSVTINILQGDIKAYIGDEIYKLTDEMLEFTKLVQKVADEVGGGYNNSHGYGSQWLGIKVGTYVKPYVYIPPKSGSSRSSSAPKKSNWDYGDLIRAGFGWKLYVKYISQRDTYVYNLVKDKDTPPNREKWDEIRGTIYTQEAFKWTPKSQTFQRWGKISDIGVVAENLFRILSQYYKSSKSSETPSEPTPQPQPEPTPIPEEPKSKLLLTNDEVIQIADAFELVDSNVWDELKIESGSQIYNDEVVQENYLSKLRNAIDEYMNKDLLNLFKNADYESRMRVYRSLENDNYHSLNNFLGLQGYFGDKIILMYVRLYDDIKDNKFKNLLNPKFFATSEEPKASKKEETEKKIKGLELFLKYETDENKRKIALNNINALKITLKYAK